MMDEYEEVHRLLMNIQPQYPSLTLDELHRIFDETYDRLIKEEDDASGVTLFLIGG